MSNEKKSPKRKGRGRRRAGYRRKSTPAKKGPQTQGNDGPGNENVEDVEEGVGDNRGDTGQTVVLNGHDDDVAHGKECQSKDLDSYSVNTLRFVRRKFLITGVDIH